MFNYIYKRDEWVPCGNIFVFDNCIQSKVVFSHCKGIGHLTTIGHTLVEYGSILGDFELNIVVLRVLEVGAYL